ncbi:hypothetical protein L7F22_059262 [Adiantum nelumboides]|nr:hypothetical protein [Adiantum nelumboides]
MKDLGDASHILGMRIIRDRSHGLLYLSQQIYVEKVLKRFNMERGKSESSTPLARHLKLSRVSCPNSDGKKAEMAKVPYAFACGSLMYAMVAIRPDIAFAMGLDLPQRSHNALKSCKEAIWLTRLVGDLGIVGEILVLQCDNQSAIQLARNLVFLAKTKHADVRYNFIKDILADKRLQLVKVHRDDNLADLLTKSLSSEWFAHLKELMGIG